MILASDLFCVLALYSFLCCLDSGLAMDWQWIDNGLSEVKYLTLFCSEGLHLALTRIRMTPAWPYLAPVWRGVSPYWNNYFMCFRFSKMQMEFVTLWYSLFVRSRWNYVKNRPIQLYWHDIKISKKILSWPHSWSRSFYLHCLIKGVFFTHSPLLWVFLPPPISLLCC